MRKLAYILGASSAFFTVGSFISYERLNVSTNLVQCTWYIRSMGMDAEASCCRFGATFDTKAEAEAGLSQIDYDSRLFTPTNGLGCRGRFELIRIVEERTSPCRIYYDELPYPQHAILVVEFADGTRWAKAVELPDPRTAGVIAIDFRTGRQLPPRNPPATR